MRRIAVTGASTPLGRRIVERLSKEPTVEAVRGVETRVNAPRRRDRDLDVVQLVPDHRPFVNYLREKRVDTVIQCGLTLDRLGGSARSGDADVIGTMGLGTAIAHEDSSVRSWVVLSSTAIYPIGSHSSLLQSEEQAGVHEGVEPGASIEEAEDYARDVAMRNPHINVSILRLQQPVGEGIIGPLADLLSNRWVPMPVGFDPPVQLLHVEDAARATVFAAIEELAGVYNVSSRDQIHWHDAIRIAGRTEVPVLPAAFPAVDPLLRLLKIPHVPADLLDLLRFGHVVDIRKLEALGWRADFDQHDCLAALTGRTSRAEGRSIGRRRPRTVRPSR